MAAARRCGPAQAPDAAALVLPSRLQAAIAPRCSTGRDPPPPVCALRTHGRLGIDFTTSLRRDPLPPAGVALRWPGSNSRTFDLLAEAQAAQHIARGRHKGPGGHTGGPGYAAKGGHAGGGLEGQHGARGPGCEDRLVGVGLRSAFLGLPAQVQAWRQSMAPWLWWAWQGGGRHKPGAAAGREVVAER